MRPKQRSNTLLQGIKRQALNTSIYGLIVLLFSLVIKALSSQKCSILLAILLATPTHPM